MDKIKLTVNGVEIETSPDVTILEAIGESGLDRIPTLCHDKRLEHFTSCFLCVVEAEGINKLLPACSVKVSPGMKILTRSQRVLETRKTALELLMSNHYADCVGPCRNDCPAGVDAQAYIALIASGKYGEALRLVKEKNPLPLSIGRVCVRDCEAACRRQYLDEPVSVNSLKRFIADLDSIDMWVPELKKDNGKKVAVIGSGPAGLSCAYYLRLEGCRVKIFEKLPKLGGMLRYGIPEYRLPGKILDAEINWLLRLGIEAETGIELGKDFGTRDLFSRGFDAVFVGVGAHKASRLGLEGEEEISRVYKGIDFLREAALGKIPELKGSVVVVGGGNTAMDAARTALRGGADKVRIVYRRSINEMPAHKEEIEAAVEEGVELNLLTNPKRLIREDGTLRAIECLKMRLVEGKPGERPKPEAVEGSEFMIECNYLISAIGQSVDPRFTTFDTGLRLDKWGTLSVSNSTMETGVNGVFAGGDAVSGPLTAVNAVAQGRKAALAIMSFLTTGTARGEEKRFYSMKHHLTGISEREFSGLQKMPRVKMPQLDALERRQNFEEVERGISESQSMAESLRCLECGCIEYSDCSLRMLCDEYKIDIENYKGEVRKFPTDNRHPLISLDPNKCIGCGRCVRTCTEILKVSALGFVYRGFKSVVKPAMEKPLMETNCISCGNCIDSCPTGAISQRLGFRIPGTIPKENIETVCSYCSSGCRVNYRKTGNDLFYISNTTQAVVDSESNGWLCTKGRFGYRHFLEGKRNFTSLIRENGTALSVSVDEAVKYAAVRLREIIKKYGEDSIALFASPRLSNEELYLLQKFARTGLGNNNIGSFSDLIDGIEPGCLDDMLGLTSSTVSMKELNNADIIVVMNSSFQEENLVMELKIKEAMKHGASLVLFSSSESRLTRQANLWIDSRKGTNAFLLNSLTGYLIENRLIDYDFLRSCPGIDEDALKESGRYTMDEALLYSGIEQEKISRLLALISEIKSNIVFVYNSESLAEKSVSDLKAIANFMLLTGRMGKKGNGIVLLREYSNSAGMAEMGARSDYLPGYVRAGEMEAIGMLERLWNTELGGFFRPSMLKEKLRHAKFKGILVFGEDPLLWKESSRYLQNAEFILAADAFKTGLTAEAGVVLPLASQIETEGSYIRFDNSIQQSARVVNNPAGIVSWQIICSLAREFAGGFQYDSLDEIREEINKADRLLRIPGRKDERVEVYIKEHLRQGKALLLPCSRDISVFDPVRPALHYQDYYYLCSIRNKLV